MRLFPVSWFVLLAGGVHVVGSPAVVTDSPVTTLGFLYQGLLYDSIHHSSRHCASLYLAHTAVTIYSLCIIW